MKKMAFMLVALLMAGSTMIAQDVRRSNMTATERAEKMTDKMVRDHSLNDTQRQRLMDLNRETFDRWGDRYDLPGENYRVEGNNMTPEQMRENWDNMRSERNAYNERVKDILTPNQYSNYLYNQNQMEERMQERAKERLLERDNR